MAPRVAAVPLDRENEYHVVLCGKPGSREVVEDAPNVEFAVGRFFGMITYEG
jgi:hypothetical protein